MTKQRNLVGNKYGKLLVIESCGQKEKGTHYMSKVRCECGKEYLVPDTELIYGRRTGCYKCSHKTHGMTNTRLFNIWQTMKQRCSDKREKNYKVYGSKGIKVCEEWLGKDGFINFYNWSIQNGYKENLTIDRIDNNKGYEPSNCRWGDEFLQANNKRNNHFITYKGKTQTIAQWSREFKIGQGTLQWRIASGWNVEKALTTQPKRGRNQYE